MLDRETEIEAQLYILSQLRSQALVAVSTGDKEDWRLHWTPDHSRYSIQGNKILSPKLRPLLYFLPQSSLGSGLERAWGLWPHINIYSWPGILKVAGDDKSMKLEGIERLTGQDAFNQEPTSQKKLYSSQRLESYLESDPK